MTDSEKLWAFFEMESFGINVLSTGSFAAGVGLDEADRILLFYFEMKSILSEADQKKTPSTTPDSQATRELVCELCRNFYQLGWASGTGGGISIKEDNHIYMAPSGVQKERLKPEDIFILNENGDYFWINRKNARAMRGFVLVRMGLSGAGAARTFLRLLAFPFAVLYLLLYAAAVHLRRKLRLKITISNT